VSPSWDALIAASGLPRLDARALAEHASGRSRTWLIAHGDEPAPPEAARAFGALATRRAAGEPLAYLLGAREFRGRAFAVTPAVLVPRPETEGLVDAALARLPAAGADAFAPRILDLGTGSGAIAVTLALERPDATVVATDASPAALAVARANARALGAADRVEFLAGDWWDALPHGTARFDVVVSNPPYVADDDPHLLDPALRHEPRSALASGPAGLDAIDAIVAGAAAHLVPGGWLLLEHGRDQGEAVRARLAAAGFDAVGTLPDLQGLDRVSLARRPPSGQSPNAGAAV
jgi:release factor glutamine methyltransferase